MDLTQKNEKATLTGIVGRWHPPALFTAATSKSREIVYGLMPDLIDAAKVEKHCLIELSKTCVTNLASGNWRKEKDNETVSYFNRTEVIELLHAITDNLPITYSGGFHVVKCRENMLNKIYYLVLQSDISLVKALFSDLQLHPFPEHQEQIRQAFVNALETLAKIGTRESLTYGIFLLVLHSVFHRDMPLLQFLYSGEELEKVIAATSPETVSHDMMPKNHVYFRDKLYSHGYYAYMFRDNYDHLYEEGRLEMTCDGGVPSAVLTLKDQSAMVPERTDPVSHHFEGIPILSGRDNLVYILMHDSNDQNATGFMMFQYTSFSNEHNCYFRSGLFLSSDHKHCPEARKIVITERKLTDEELPVVQGILKTSGQQIVMSRKQMENFCNDYKEKYPWIEEFKESIPSYLQDWYCFSDKMLMTNADPNMEEIDRLKLVLAMKSYCRGSIEPFNLVNCKENRHTYKIML